MQPPCLGANHPCVLQKTDQKKNQDKAKKFMRTLLIEAEARHYLEFNETFAMYLWDFDIINRKCPALQAELTKCIG